MTELIPIRKQIYTLACDWWGVESSSCWGRIDKCSISKTPIGGKLLVTNNSKHKATLNRSLTSLGFLTLPNKTSWSSSLRTHQSIWLVLMPRAPDDPRSCQMDGCATSTKIGSWFSRYTCKRHPDRVSGRTIRWFC